MYQLREKIDSCFTPIKSDIVQLKKKKKKVDQPNRVCAKFAYYRKLRTANAMQLFISRG